LGPGSENPRAVGLVVTGALTVAGAIINANLGDGPFLIVQGCTQARAIYAGGAEFRFEGKVRITDVVVGCYNDGYMRFTGGLEAPLVVSEKHAFDVRGPSPPLFNPIDGHADVASWAAFLDPRLDLAAGSGFDAVDIQDQLLPLIRNGSRIVRAGFGG
jgi:hypothetical protein